MMTIKLCTFLGLVYPGIPWYTISPCILSSTARSPRPATPSTEASRETSHYQLRLGLVHHACDAGLVAVAVPCGSVSKPCTPGEHQNSWDLWMFIPLKMVLIGIDPYPCRSLVLDLRSQRLVSPETWLQLLA